MMIKRCFGTVYALSSGHGTCGVAVIRITGPNSGQALLKMTGKSKLPIPRQAQLVKLINPSTKEILDHALSLWFPGTLMSRINVPIRFLILERFSCQYAPYSGQYDC